MKNEYQKTINACPGESCGGGMPFRTQGADHESSAFLLLLGACGRGTDFHCFFRIFGIGNWKVLAGDLGCSGGPTVVGMVSSFFGEDLKKGILAAVLFPLLLLFGIGQCKKSAANI